MAEFFQHRRFIGKKQAGLLFDLQQNILKEENPNNLSWKTKQLRFNDTPLEKVIRDLNEYYQVEIINKVDSPDSRLTATFNDLPLDEVLMVINQTLDIRLVPRKDK